MKNSKNKLFQQFKNDKIEKLEKVLGGARRNSFSKDDPPLEPIDPFFAGPPVRPVRE